MPGIIDCLCFSTSTNLGECEILITPARASKTGKAKFRPVCLALMLRLCCLQAADISMLTDMAKYMNLAGGADDGVHAPITNVIWWCWNANSARARRACMHGTSCISVLELNYHAGLEIDYQTIRTAQHALCSP